MCVWCWACVNGCWACVCGTGHVCMVLGMHACRMCVVLGGVGALPCQATLSLLLLCCGHVAVIVVIVAPWQWPQASHCCHRCGVALSLSPLFRGHIIIIFGGVVVGLRWWWAHSDCEHSLLSLSLSSLIFAMALAMGVTSLSLSSMLLVVFGCWMYHCHPCIVSILAPSLPSSHPCQYVIPVLSLMLSCVCAMVVIDVREGGGWGQVGVREQECDSPFVIVILYVCCCGV